MKKFIITGMVSMLLSLHALSATNIQDIYSSTMTVVDARYGFENVQNVFLQLVKQGGVATEMILEFQNQGEDNFYSLMVTNTYSDDDGCINYHASLKNNNSDNTDNEDFLYGQRFSVSLVDNSSCSHGDSEAGIWQASVRSGYGWCGTMDSTMELRGNPAQN